MVARNNWSDEDEEDGYTWEYKLRQAVRWGTEDTKDDVVFYVKRMLEEIANQEGYKLVKKKQKQVKPWKNKD